MLTFFIFPPLCPLLCIPQYLFCILLAFISITIILYFSELSPHFLLCPVLSLIVSNYPCFVVFPQRQLFATFWCIVFNLSQCFNYNFYSPPGQYFSNECSLLLFSRKVTSNSLRPHQFSSVQWLSHV